MRSAGPRLRRRWPGCAASASAGTPGCSTISASTGECSARPRFGTAGTVAMPYVVLFEAAEPLVEILGFAIVITLIAVNSVNWTYLLAFFLVAIVTSQVLKATALLIEESGFRRYHSRDLALLAAWGLVEALWFRPALAWW